MNATKTTSVAAPVTQEASRLLVIAGERAARNTEIALQILPKDPDERAARDGWDEEESFWASREGY